MIVKASARQVGLRHDHVDANVFEATPVEQNARAFDDPCAGLLLVFGAIGHRRFLPDQQVDENMFLNIFCPMAIEMSCPQAYLGNHFEKVRLSDPGSETQNVCF
jgi:hypothetical protein